METISCPACNGDSWPTMLPSGKPLRGRRVCAQCRSTVAITNDGTPRIRIFAPPLNVDTTCAACRKHSWPSRVRGLRVCPSCRTTILLSRDGSKAIKAAREPESFYQVVSPLDGTILCAACSKRTSISQSIDGRARGRRGRICQSCQAHPSARSVGSHKPKTGTTYSVIRPLTKNSEQQDDEALFGLGVIDEYRRQNRPIGYGVNLQGANWAHTGDDRWITSAGSTPSHPADCACLEHKRQSRIEPIYYPAVKYGDTREHLQGLIAGSRAHHVQYVFNPPSSIARYALSVVNQMVGVQRSHVRASARIADYERSLPRAISPTADQPIHRTAYDTLMRHARRFRLRTLDIWTYHHHAI